MSGETNLMALLANMRPGLSDQTYVFFSDPQEQINPWKNKAILGTFREKEGMTYIIEKSEADRLKLQTDLVFRCITLHIHSSLEAVGLTAAIAKALTDAGISANVVAAAYHDHIFVPAMQAKQALGALQQLSDQAKLQSQSNGNQTS